MNDSDDQVVETACRLLSDRAARLERNLQSAIQSGDVAAAQRITNITQRVLAFGYEEANSIRNSIGKWLDTGDRDQCVAALLALAKFYQQDDQDEKWLDLSNLARAAFLRHGLEDLWRPFAAHARSLDETHRGFIHRIFQTFDQELKQLACLVTWAVELWPDDIESWAYRVTVDISRGNAEEATSHIKAMQEQFGDRINDAWIGDQFLKLDRHESALYHYGIAMERDPTDFYSHFAIGWSAFVVGDLERSIESSRRGLALNPISAIAEYNLGLALLARGDNIRADIAYRRGIALVKRIAAAEARDILDGALGDFPLLAELSDDAKKVRDRSKTRLEEERDRLSLSE